MGSQKSKIPAGGMETRKTNKFWKLGARAAEGKPTYQNSRVKGIIQINKSFSEKLRLYMSKANGNVPELWKVRGENKHSRPKEQLCKCLHWQSKTLPITAKAASQEADGTHTLGRQAKNSDAMTNKMKLYFPLRTWMGNLAQQQCARAALSGNVSKDLPWSKK